jgi:tetratricopeptide (TPR) repeat protein
MKQHENIKDQKSKIKNTDHGLNIFQLLFAILIFLFLLLNIFSSQIVSPIYFQIINYNQKAVSDLLQKIKDLPEYQKILEMNNNIYGKTIEEEVFSQKNKNKTAINNLEQILIKNPNSRDILYSLYQLNLAEGNKIKAEEYLRQAKIIDPNIN